ncbi:acyl carrier protein [Streptomyces sp. TS71-3]|uniref:acyl carrier protein n=1 Tax=Streptomyces sp. TS71-3 TaxID=2733862 RepID=UPI001B165854|nr:acyl carrier protein [Streptomyces sp. TS71-3]GHJ36881.1 hypothetical protein Sm713_24900 [Streptomyces sp. TS71-3]
MTTETQMTHRTYDLVSLLYHTLKESATLEMYIEDARKAGDDELSGFLQSIQAEDGDRVRRAEQMLTGRLQGGG